MSTDFDDVKINTTTRTHTRTHVHEHTHTHTRTHAHTHTHTHTYQQNGGGNEQNGRQILNALQHTATHCNALQRTATTSGMVVANSRIVDRYLSTDFDDVKTNATMYVIAEIDTANATNSSADASANGAVNAGDCA